MYEPDLIKKYVFWLADYSGEADVPCAYHQYTNKGKVPGINGDIDMDYFYDTENKEDGNIGRTAQDYLNVWRSWLGFSEANGKFKQIIDLYNSHKPLARGYAVQYRDEWCDTIVSAAAIAAGMVDLIGVQSADAKSMLRSSRQKESGLRMEQSFRNLDISFCITGIRDISRMTDIPIISA